jgi:rhodanese-related sulfurtransferase
MKNKFLVTVMVGLFILGLAFAVFAQSAEPKKEPAASPALQQPAAAPAASPQAAPEATLPKDKQTVLNLYVTAKEAYDLYQKDPDKIKIVDCRTPEEYAFIGHAAMAYNIPSKFMTYKWDDKKKEYAMRENPKFVAQVKKHFKAGDTILVMCRSGQRSAPSVNKLAKAGFKQVYNVTDGFEGDKIKDPNSPNQGKRMKNGWRNSQLPWTYDLDPRIIYLSK